MTTYKIAHIHEQGQDLIIIPLDERFDYSTSDEKKAEVAAYLQRCSTSAGLKGHVVIVWPVGTQMKFLAPPAWHSFVRSLTLDMIYGLLNRELRCD